MVPFGPLQRVETVSGIKMTFLAFGIEVPLPPVTFSAAWNSRLPLKRRWGRMTQGELSFGRVPVSSWSLPNWASISSRCSLLGSLASSERSLQAGKAEKWSWFHSKDYPEHCERELAAGTIPLFLSLACWKRKNWLQCLNMCRIGVSVSGSLWMLLSYVPETQNSNWRAFLLQKLDVSCDEALPCSKNVFCHLHFCRHVLFLDSLWMRITAECSSLKFPSQFFEHRVFWFLQFQITGRN